jgi:hypothetical protein
MTGKIEVPVTFNAHKHHFQFLVNKIELWKKLDWQQVEPEIFLIGENLIDFYTGQLPVEKLINQSYQFFSEKGIIGKPAFSEWLYPAEYRKITLDDLSEWVIKLGNDADKYIHIHPAKYSPNTIRVRAATLKTVVALMIENGAILAQTNENLAVVNHIRDKYLLLSPVKSLQHGKGILKLWEMFSNHH